MDGRKIYALQPVTEWTMIFIVNCMCLFGQHFSESREKRILVSQIPVHMKYGNKLVSPIWNTVLSETMCTF